MASARFQRATSVSTVAVVLFTSVESDKSSTSGNAPHGMEITVNSGTADILVEPICQGTARRIASSDTPNTWTIVAWNDGMSIKSVTATGVAGAATVTTSPIM